ncbi:MAG: diacylglycerol kinase family protein [Bacillota bacterium]
MSRQGRDLFRHTRLLPRFRDAFRGVALAYREEPNLRFHLFAASCAGVAGYAVRLSAWEAAYLGLTITLVLFAEMVNTAVERTVDLVADGRRHPLAATAKEVAAGAVLLAAGHAAFAAAFLFLIERSYFQTISALLHLLVYQPAMLIPPVVTAVMGLFGGARGSHS